jgi:hypothetical protein
LIRTDPAATCWPPLAVLDEDDAGSDVPVDDDIVVASATTAAPLLLLDDVGERGCVPLVPGLDAAEVGGAVDGGGGAHVAAGSALARGGGSDGFAAPWGW